MHSCTRLAPTNAAQHPSGTNDQLTAILHGYTRIENAWRALYTTETTLYEQSEDMANVTAPTAEPLICERGGHGDPASWLRFESGAAEWGWSNGVRAFLYTLFLGWLFQGVAIIADVFMNAIEEITAKRKTIVVDGKDFHVAWNDTVANLTLMALGSSAPEILLSVVEIMGGRVSHVCRHWHSTSLITAVCASMTAAKNQ